MNSTLGKLVITASALRAIRTTKATTLIGSNQFYVTDLTINAIDTFGNIWPLQSLEFNL